MTAAQSSRERPDSRATGPARNALTIKLGRDDRIVSVSSGWDDAAVSAGGAGCTSSAVIGTPFFEHIKDKTTRRALRIVLASARRLQTELVFDYRCDGPSEKRFMRMRVEADRDGPAWMHHELLRTERRPTRIRSVSVLDGAAPGSPRELVRRCSLCNKYDEGAGWVDLLDGIESRTLRVVHTVCPACRDRVHALRHPAVTSSSDRG